MRLKKERGGYSLIIEGMFIVFDEARFEGTGVDLYKNGWLVASMDADKLTKDIRDDLRSIE